MTAYRLSTGGLVNRSRPLSFQFDGKEMKGLEGDTLAAALLANDQLLVGRSFKYHRPRGILTAGWARPKTPPTTSKDDRPTAN
ncbi:2Fe-2S iron-sulfur cluster-binding protein, partial [Rhizobium sp. LEGMi12c]